MPRYDKKTGELIDPDAPFKPSTIADSIPELANQPLPGELGSLGGVHIEKESPATQTATFTMADVLAMLKELKQPNEVEQFRYEQEKKKVEQERLAQLNRAERARQNAILVEQQKQSTQSICGHVKPNGRTQLAGQVNSDGYWRPLCIRCGKVLPKVKAPDEWKTGGVNTQMGLDVAGAMGFLNEQTLLAWHRGTVPNCQERCCKPIAVSA